MASRTRRTHPAMLKAHVVLAARVGEKTLAQLAQQFDALYSQTGVRMHAKIGSPRPCGPERRPEIASRLLNCRASLIRHPSEVSVKVGGEQGYHFAYCQSFRGPLLYLTCVGP